jgi:hypothetical protein
VEEFEAKYGSGSRAVPEDAQSEGSIGSDGTVRAALATGRTILFGQTEPVTIRDKGKGRAASVSEKKKVVSAPEGVSTSFINHACFVFSY